MRWMQAPGAGLRDKKRLTKNLNLHRLRYDCKAGEDTEKYEKYQKEEVWYYNEII